MTRPGRLCTNVYLSLTCCAGIGGALQPWLNFSFFFLYLNVFLTGSAHFKFSLEDLTRLHLEKDVTHFLLFSHILLNNSHRARLKEISVVGLRASPLFIFCLVFSLSSLWSGGKELMRGRYSSRVSFCCPIEICNSHIWSVKLP